MEEREQIRKILCKRFRKEMTGLECTCDEKQGEGPCESATYPDEKLNIRVMADFSSTGLWDMNDDGIMIEYEDLALPKSLIEEFDNWIRYYDSCFEDDYSTFKPNMSEKLNDWGLKLAEKIKEIYPNSRVVYWKEDESGLAIDEIEIGI